MACLLSCGKQWVIRCMGCNLLVFAWSQKCSFSMQSGPYTWDIGVTDSISCDWRLEFEWNLDLTGLEKKKILFGKNGVISDVSAPSWKVTSFGMKSIPFQTTLPWQLDFSCSRSLLRQRISFKHWPIEHFNSATCYSLTGIKVSFGFRNNLTYCTAWFWPIF